VDTPENRRVVLEGLSSPDQQRLKGHLQELYRECVRQMYLRSLSGWLYLGIAVPLWGVASLVRRALVVTTSLVPKSFVPRLVSRYVSAMRVSRRSSFTHPVRRVKQKIAPRAKSEVEPALFVLNNRADQELVPILACIE
jgi:hypothetical protein